jgi:hypothetical protein
MLNLMKTLLFKDDDVPPPTINEGLIDRPVTAIAVKTKFEPTHRNSQRELGSDAFSYYNTRKFLT